MRYVIPFNNVLSYIQLETNRRHYSLAGFTLRSISVSALCQRCEGILAQDDFTWSSLHLHPYPLSLSLSPSLIHSMSLSLSLIHCIPLTVFHSLHLLLSTAVRQSPSVCLFVFFLPSHSLLLIHSSVSYSVTFNSFPLLSLSLSVSVVFSLNLSCFISLHSCFLSALARSHSYSCKFPATQCTYSLQQCGCSVPCLWPPW